MVAVVTFAAFLGFSLFRLFQVEQDMRSNVSENMLWVITQAQVASHRLDEEVHRRVLGDEQARPGLRHDVLTSRLVLLDEGPQRRYLAELGFAAAVDEAFDRLEAIEPLLQDLEPGRHEAADAIYTLLKPMMMSLNRLANEVMIEEWENTGERLDEHRSNLLQVIASVVGILLSGLLLAILLIGALRQRMAAERLERSLTQERQRSDFYRSFAAMVSHQFRTPLAVIDASLQRLIRRGERMSPQERQARYGRVRDAVGQMTRLVDSSLTTARLDGGQVTVTPARHDLREIAQQVCRLQQEATDIPRISLTGPPRLPVRCDRSLAEQILANLIANALKYSSEESSVEVYLARRGDHAECRIVDHGIGIAKQDLPHLFERYFRARNATSSQGIGLGLHIARQLARLQHGDITVTSKINAGTTMTLTLPLSDREATP
ncbi:HAMP domain-containing histidine kinase [Halomonas campisalis]|uniref:histidine kinase n=2 Tax=Billgrantia campisalis TaxID=74661 RepID=A0ABS9P7A7_9GAMM|nr:HAMP domain-containing histidine kinase [Halomonas campisalis]